MLDDGDETGNPRSGAGEISACTGGVGLVEDLAEEIEVRLHFAQHVVGRPAVIAAPVPLECRLQVSQVASSGARQGPVDTLACLCDARQCG